MTKNRIAELRKAAGLSQTDLAERIGTTLNNLGKLERGERRLNQDWIDRIAAALNVDPGELLHTTQRAAQSTRPLDMKRAPEQMPTRGAFDDVGAVRLKSLNLELAMGDGTDLAEWFEETDVAFDANWLSSVSPAPFDRLIIGRGVGDSMKPTIGDQDDVLIDLDQNELKRADRIYAITIDGAGAVKRLMPSPDKGMIEVVSDNPDHAARVRTYPKPMIKIIGRVVWSGRRH